jgi:integrase
VRERFAVRREPYWQRLAEGAYLGFRRGPDTWLARFRGRDRRQQYEPLGEGLEFDEAKRRAENWLAQLSGSAVRSVKRESVAAALQAYLAYLRQHGRHEAARDATLKFRAVGLMEKRLRKGKPTAGLNALANRALEAVTRDDFVEWRERLLEGRQPRTINRYVRGVAAGLNRALELGHVGNPSAWALSPLVDDTEEEGTAIFLTPAQRAGLISCASASFAAFSRGLELSGARPKELASAKVSDFDGESLRLTHRKGRPAKLRTRFVVLGNEGVEFFKSQTDGRGASEPLFTEDGQHAWRQHTRAAQMRAAVAAFNMKAKTWEKVPDEIGAYAFRHARISELLQVHDIDPLTVAAQTGTSLAMIERAYFKFIPNAMKKKLAAVKETSGKT